MNDLTAAMDRWGRLRRAEEKANEHNRAAVFDALAASGITSVSVDWDGEGDSGQIEGIAAFTGDAAAALPEAEIAVQSVARADAEPDTRTANLAGAASKASATTISPSITEDGKTSSGSGPREIHHLDTTWLLPVPGARRTPPPISEALLNWRHRPERVRASRRARHRPGLAPGAYLDVVVLALPDRHRRELGTMMRTPMVLPPREVETSSAGTRMIWTLWR